MAITHTFRGKIEAWSAILHPTMAKQSIKQPRFRCTGCGQCCTGDPATHYVAVSRDEQKRIYRFLGISARQFRRQYLETAADDSEGIRLLDSNRCPFLQPDQRCRIYSVRPDQCLTYPFWPELVTSQANWEQEQSRCEGIGRGPVLAASEIQARLSLHRKNSGQPD